MQRALRSIRLPDVLWHGSAYKTEVLKPGFLWTRKLVEWEHGESNHYLYATTEREAAIALGFANAVKKAFRVSRCKFYGDRVIVIEAQHSVSVFELLQLPIYLYEIRPEDDQSWVRNHNPRHPRESEFKTHLPIATVRAEQIDLHAWLRNKDLNFRKATPSCLPTNPSPVPAPLYSIPTLAPMG
jgi:hypothetical protein